MASGQSQVNQNFPTDNVPVSKADWREQQRTIKNELTTVLRRTSVAWDIFTNNGELL